MRYTGLGFQATVVCWKAQERKGKKFLYVDFSEGALKSKMKPLDIAVYYLEIHFVLKYIFFKFSLNTSVKVHVQ